MTGRKRIVFVVGLVGVGVAGSAVLLTQRSASKGPNRPAGAAQPVKSAEAQAREVANAEEAMRKAIEKSPDDFDARMAYAASLGQGRKYGEAMEQLRAAGRLNPKSAEPHLAMSEIFDVAFMLDMSLAAARAAVAVDPTSVRALARLGQLTMGLDGNVAAVRLMSDAVREHPDTASLWVVLALVKYQMNDFRGALEAVSTAQKLEPSNRALDGTLIDIHLKLGNPEQALAAAETAAKWQPESTIPLLGKARALRAMRRFADAEQSAAAALVVDPNNEAAIYDRALSLLAMGKYADAVGLLEPIVARNPRYERASVNLADAYTRLGRREDATRAIRKFDALEKQTDDAVRALLRVGNQPDNPEAHRAAGAAHLKQGRVPRAVVEYAEAMRLRPEDPGIREDLAKALEAMQRNNEAQAVRGSAGAAERKQR